MAFEGLTEKISAAFKKLRGKGRLKESDIKEATSHLSISHTTSAVNIDERA